MGMSFTTCYAKPCHGCNLTFSKRKKISGIHFIASGNKLLLSDIFMSLVLTVFVFMFRYKGKKVENCKVSKLNTESIEVAALMFQNRAVYDNVIDVFLYS